MKQQNTFDTKTPRIHLIDYIRCILYLAIASFHFVSIVWVDRGYAFGGVTSYWWMTEQYARTFVYGGHIILTLTFALMGFRQDSNPKLKKILIGSALGAVLMSIADYPENNSFFIWDIYPLIFVGTSVLLIARRHFSFLAVLGFLLLQFKFWNFLEWTGSSVELKAAVVGDCLNDYGNWPLLPWVGLIWFSFGLGKWAYRFREKLQVLHSSEWILWVLIICFGVYNFNSYRYAPSNVKWACYVFRREPYEFLSQLFLYILLFRIALLNRVQKTFEKFFLSKWIEGLYFTRSFGLFYMTHYLLMSGTFFFFKDYFAEKELVSFAVFIFQLILAEILMRSVSTLLKNKV
ncbi:MAG: hypothetical protein ACXVAX_01575 [Pseudobdellovibrio sp.]